MSDDLDEYTGEDGFDSEDFDWGFDPEDYVVKFDGTYLLKFTGYERKDVPNDDEKCAHVFKFVVQNEGRMYGQFVQKSIRVFRKMTEEKFEQLQENMQKFHSINAAELAKFVRWMEIPKRTNPNMLAGQFYEAHIVTEESGGYTNHNFKKMEAVEAPDGSERGDDEMYG